MKSTFSIIFYLKRQVVKKDGTVPVMGRITVDGTQAQFSCKTTANPNLWDTKGGRMIGKSMQALEVNRKLDKMRVSISKHYQEIMDRDNFVTADKVKNAFLGLEYRCHTLMKVYSQSRDEMEKQYKAGMKSLSTYTKYRIGCAYVGEFLQTHYHVKDIALKELSLPFITDYETFLRTDKHLKINSAMVFVRNLRAMVFRAIDIFSALSLSSTRLRDFGIMRHTATTAILRFGYQRTRMSGMTMASPEVVTSSTSQGSSSTAMSLWHKPSSYLKRLVAASRHRFRIIKR